MIADSNVVIDIFEVGGAEASSSRLAVARQLLRGSVLINLVIFAEVSARFASATETDTRLTGVGLTLAPLNSEVAYRAGKAFRDYRRRGGLREAILPDFFIGAHAEVLDVPILTRDTRRFATYFPTVHLIDPTKDQDD